VPESGSDQSFEREKWVADVRLREREIAVKEEEAKAKSEELKRSRWRDPIVLAVLAAAFAAGGNAVVAVINGNLQRSADERRANADNSLQAMKGTEERQIEEGKAEAARILEMIKTADPDKAAVNLAFLLDAGLIADPDRKKNLAAFLRNRLPGEGPTLPSVSTAPAAGHSTSYVCALKDPESDKSLLDAMVKDLGQAPETKDRKYYQTKNGIILDPGNFGAAPNSQAPTQKSGSTKSDQSIAADQSNLTLMMMLMTATISDGGVVRVASSPDGAAIITYASEAFAPPYGSDFVDVTKNTVRRSVKDQACIDRPFNDQSGSATGRR
jgi:hypothetical protein